MPQPTPFLEKTDLTTDIPPLTLQERKHILSFFLDLHAAILKPHPPELDDLNTDTYLSLYQHLSTLHITTSNPFSDLPLPTHHLLTLAKLRSRLNLTLTLNDTPICTYNPLSNPTPFHRDFEYTLPQPSLFTIQKIYFYCSSSTFEATIHISPPDSTTPERCTTLTVQLQLPSLKLPPGELLPPLQQACLSHSSNTCALEDLISPYISHLSTLFDIINNLQAHLKAQNYQCIARNSDRQFTPIPFSHPLNSPIPFLWQFSFPHLDPNHNHPVLQIYFLRNSRSSTPFFTINTSPKTPNSSLQLPLSPDSLTTALNAIHLHHQQILLTNLSC